MNLILNNTYHWQLPSGAELYSGEAIELYRDGSWVPGRIEYRPRRHYILILETGEEVSITEDLQLRALERKAP